MKNKFLSSTSQPKAPELVETRETFKCEGCGRTFAKGRSDEEALKEYQEVYQGFAVGDKAAVCDDCYQKIMGVLRQ